MNIPKTAHKFDFEQTVEVHDDSYPPTVQIVAKLVGPCCSKHNAPYYGAVHGGDHFTLCEGLLAPLSPAAKRKMD
jgi:hypothetical protein